MAELKLLGHLILFALCLIPGTLLTNGPAGAAKAYLGSWFFALLWFIPLEAVFWFPLWYPYVAGLVPKP